MEEVLRDVDVVAIDVVADVGVLRDVDIVQGVVKDPPVPRPSVCQTGYNYHPTSAENTNQTIHDPFTLFKQEPLTLIELLPLSGNIPRCCE